MESKCVIMDLIVAKQNINITNKINNGYELNRHFQVTWALNPPWAKSILSFRWKSYSSPIQSVCTWIKGKDKLLLPKLDSLL